MLDYPETKISSLQAALIKETGQMQIIRLSGTPGGRYCFEPDGEGSELICLEAMDGKWYAKCEPPAEYIFSDESHGGSSRNRFVELTDCSLFNVRIKRSVCALYVQEMAPEQNIYRNYSLKQGGQTILKIGRTLKSDICYLNPTVSREHAVLQFCDRKWTIFDTNSKNYVFVNGRCIKKQELHPGDVIYIMGLQIIIGYGYISLNQNAAVNPQKLQPVRQYNANCKAKVQGEQAQRKEEKLFNRFPRKRLPVNTPEIAVEAPPMSLTDSNMPMILRMGSSLVMGGSALMMGNFMMILSSLMFPFLRQRFTDKEKKEYEEKRTTRYNGYLAQKRLEIEEEIEKEEKLLNSNFPCLARILEYPNGRFHLWGRRKSDDDFLDLRLGYGTQNLLAPIKYPEQRFNLQEDVLESKMYKLANTAFELKNVPVICSLMQDYICGALGQRSLVLEFVRRMIMQLCILYSYDEVKIIILANPGDLENLEFVRYLPHIWNDQRSLRFLATDTMETYVISEELRREMEEQLGRKNELKDILKKHPYYVVFALEKKIFDSMEIWKDIMQEDCNQGVSIVAAFDDLPKECMKIFQLEENGKHSVVHVRQIEQEDQVFRFDDYERAKAEQSMKVLANTKLKIISQAYSLPKMLTFLEMFGVGRIEHLNLLKRWSENNPVKSLAAPVGVTTDGNLFELDLHEKFQGPHGLVAGTTGSGKSEFLITYILSMAVNYHPDEVAFVLIDYKGGGLAGAFDDPKKKIHLPHLAGTITNLDGAAIQRSLMSIHSELTRRQQLFNEARSMTNEGTMDIYSYQRLYREKKVPEPLPHLFIISDEFAELKQQEPEFMDELISAARIGRSLGVHLILATQKPTGVVNDQIQSNSKFRVCLKVQSKSDSIDMLQRADAAELKDTGRFYLQVGYNEFFALGQSAWCGADYEPQDQVLVKRDESVQVLDCAGQVLFEAEEEIRKQKSDNKQIVAIVRMLTETANREGFQPRLLWEQPLDKKISLQFLNEKYPFRKDGKISIQLGMVDDPGRQKQYPWQFDLQKCQNLLIAGEGGSGKSVFLQSLLFFLAEQYSPEEVNFYTMDFSGKMLNLFGGLPHCGACLDEDSEIEIPRLFDMITKMVSDRKKLFSAAEVSNYDDYIVVRKIPLVLVVIDNINGLMELKNGDNYYRSLAVLMRDGVSYGIKFVVTAANPGDYNFRIRQSATDRLAFRLVDRYAFGGFLDCSCKYAPPKVKGRGLCLVKGEPLEFHAAMYGAGMEERKRITSLKEALKEISERCQGMKAAECLLRVREGETYEEFCRGIAPGRIPLGYLLTDVKKVSMPLCQLSSISLYFGNPAGRAPVLDNLLYASSREGADVLIVKKNYDSVLEQGGLQNFDAACMNVLEGDSDGRQLYDLLFERIAYGNQIVTEFCQREQIPLEKEKRSDKEADAVKKHLKAQMKPVFILLEDITGFCDMLSSEYMGKYGALFSNGKSYNLFFIGCYYPGEAVIPASQNAHSMFNEDKFILLFGGQYHRQKLVSLPRELVQEKMLEKYHNFIMQYRSNSYLMSMPCGELREAERNEEEASIV